MKSNGIMDMNSEKELCVEIAGGKPGVSGAFLDAVYDAEEKKYFAPVNQDLGVEKLHSVGFTGEGISIAILDSGLLTHHPSFSKRIVESVDFTDTGQEDQNGHGTVVALLAMTTAPGASLYNVKVLNNEGYGSKKALIKGIQWAASRKVNIINISAGIYPKKWGFLDCEGTCNVCRAAEVAAEQGVQVIAAAGNTPGITMCPGTSPFVIAVEAYDMETLIRVPSSGNGIISAPVGKYLMREVESE